MTILYIYQLLSLLATLANHLLAVQTVSVVKSTAMQFALVNLVTLVLLLYVDLSVLSALNAHRIKHVLIRNVSILVLVLVE